MERLNVLYQKVYLLDTLAKAFIERAIKKRRNIESNKNRGQVYALKIKLGFDKELSEKRLEVMTEEQSIDLRVKPKKIHDQVHSLYPQNKTFTEVDKYLRNQLLVVDLAVHLASEVINNTSLSEQQVVEKTVNLLYAVKLVAKSYPLEKVAELLLNYNQETID